MKLTKEEQLIQEERDARSMELFDKPECELQIAERALLAEYTHDLAYPEWKQINYNGQLIDYEISNTGLVRNMKTGTVRKPTEVWSGYQKINVYADKKCYTLIIHRLVGLHFIDNPDNLPVLNHKNGKKTLNWYKNLEWCTYQENTQHAIQTGLAGRNGVENPNNRYPIEVIHQVCKMLESGMGCAAISKQLGVNKSLPNSIKQGKLWKDITAEYNIPKPVNITRPDDLKAYITELIYAGYSNREIVQAAGLPDTEHEREYVGLFRRRLYKKTT